MNYPDFFYKTITFFFDFGLHFLQLLILIFIFRRDIDRVFNIAKMFFINIRTKYKSYITRIDSNPLAEAMKKFEPEILRNYKAVKQNKEPKTDNQNKETELE